jgi:two-component system, cell cycle sensor histidine kinase and response regulator CckA
MTYQRYPCANEQSLRPTVLLVEDEPFVREATRCILQSAGFDVLPAADAQEAIQVYQQNGCNIDLLMSDLVLPGRNGRQLGEDLRCRSPQLPILLTSGYIDTNFDLDSREAQTYYLAKPYCRADLVEKVKQIFREVPLRGAAAQAG